MHKQALTQLHIWCAQHGWQSCVCRIADTQASNSENTKTTGRPNALVVWQERRAPRTLLLNEALVMSEAAFVDWLVGERKVEVA